ncbi:MAG TPA: helicase-related protein, partial [Pirellulaceae bacterium]|nr:helicase-related protein [Pirellulaceae bacterium]
MKQPVQPVDLLKLKASRLMALIRAHRSTILFVNNRRSAERLAATINELAHEQIAVAHHGSIAKEARLAAEQRLKSGDLPAIVATSSLELGIDMGSVDLVIQISSPPSIAAGMQRIGRAGHQVGAASKGIVLPKFRGDVLACAAASRRMMSGEVERTAFPRNPLDVLAQQIVAMVATRPSYADDLYATVRRAAPFHELPRKSFDGVLDLLSGRYPSDQFSELRPRVTWDRATGQVTARPGAQRIAVVNAGTIPDRGLYGVYLAGATGPAARVGELDEEMVFETKIDDVFLLGATSWRVTDITEDRVLVTPAPGEAARMPFWRGEGPGRPLEFGRAIGR